ncbi:thioredoxin-dependent thiol peroxidase [Candidatus Gottesmanbacteria bacterium]|nr:thioredoxin-dependent thiol peroxidase [Candidatus Gottesmanbacteria bacterium]
MKAKDFNLPDQDGVMHSLSQYKGKWVVVYFYPKDDTPGCTKEACNFRDALGDLQKLGVVILGVSKDSVASHKKFSEKYHLNFPILSDESKETIKAYHAWGEKKFMGKTFEGIFRTTYLIDGQGEVRKAYKKVDPASHATEILHDMKLLA